MKTEIFERLTKADTVSFAKIASRAYKRLKYFSAILSLNALHPSSPKYALISYSEETVQQYRDQITQIETGTDVLTEQEQDEMMGLLPAAEESEGSKRIQAQEENRKKYLNLEKELEELKVIIKTEKENHEIEMEKLYALKQTVSSGTNLSVLLARLKEIQV